MIRTGLGRACRRAAELAGVACACLVAVGGCATGQGASDAGLNARVPETAVDEEVVPEEKPTSDSGPLGMLGKVGRLVDNAQRVAAESFDDFMLDLDDFFAGDYESDEINTSYVRLRFDLERDKLGGTGLDPTVKLRVVLPRSEQRFQLLFSTEDERGLVGDDSDDPVRLDSARARENVSFALRFVRGARNATNLDFDLGLRRRRGLIQFYVRSRASVDGELGAGWKVRASNRYFYYFRTGFENQFRLDFSRQLGSRKSRYLLASTSFDWKKGRQGAAIGQTLGAYTEIGRRGVLALEALAAYDTSVPPGNSERFRGSELRLRWRHSVWRPWLFYELWPAISWPAERDYRRSWSLLARLEVTIGGEYEEFPEETMAEPPPGSDLPDAPSSRETVNPTRR